MVAAVLQHLHHNLRLPLLVMALVGCGAEPSPRPSCPPVTIAVATTPGGLSTVPSPSFLEELWDPIIWAKPRGSCIDDEACFAHMNAMVRNRPFRPRQKCFARSFAAFFDRVRVELR